MFTMRLTSLPSLRIGLLNSDEIRRLRPKIGNDVTSFWSMEMSADLFSQGSVQESKPAESTSFPEPTLRLSSSGNEDCTWSRNTILNNDCPLSYKSLLHDNFMT